MLSAWVQKDGLVASKVGRELRLTECNSYDAIDRCSQTPQILPGYWVLGVISLHYCGDFGTSIHFHGRRESSN